MLNTVIEKLGKDTVRTILNLAKRECKPIGLCRCGIIFIKEHKDQTYCIVCEKKPCGNVLEKICQCGCNKTFTARYVNQKYRPECCVAVRKKQIYRSIAKRLKMNGAGMRNSRPALA